MENQWVLGTTYLELEEEKSCMALKVWKSNWGSEAAHMITVCAVPVASG